MECIKCNGENFILESTVVVTEKYRIYKNGKVSDHPFIADTANEYLAKYDNLVRCLDCGVAYLLLDKSRQDLLFKTDFSKIDLVAESEITNY